MTEEHPPAVINDQQSPAREDVAPVAIGLRRVYHDWRLRYRARTGRSPGPLTLLFAPLDWIAWGWWRLTVALFGLFTPANARNLALGAPAVLAAAVVVAIAVAGMRIRDVDLARQYRAAVEQAFQKADFQAARVYGERLVELDGGSHASVFRLALACDELDEKDRAVALMRSLVAQENGFAPARLWLATRVLANSGASVEERQWARAQLMRVLADQSANAQAHSWLGRLCLQEGRAEEAEVHLRVAASAYPEHYLTLARLAARHGDTELAEQYSERGQAAFRRALDRDMDDRVARLRLAESLLAVEEFDEAARVLADGLTLAPADAEMRKLLAATHIAKADRAVGEGGASRTLSACREALRVDPWNELALRRLLALDGTKGRLADEARRELERMLARGDATATAHMVLGNDAQARGRHDEARRHLDLAYELDPRLAVVANNLAWVLAHSEPSDLPRALSIISALLARFPDTHAFRDTRGRVLLKMGRAEEALVDLESALASFPKDAGLHLALAECYRTLGDEALAAEHLRLSGPRADTGDR